MTPRTATVTVYDTPGTGSPLTGYNGTIEFPTELGGVKWNYIHESFGCHTFRLPFPNVEAYAIRFTCGVVNGPVTPRGIRFDRIEVVIDGAGSVSLPSSVDLLTKGNPYYSASDDTLVIGGDNGVSTRHQISSVHSIRCRFVVDGDANTVFASAKMVRKSIPISPGIDAPIPASLALTGGSLASARGYRFGPSDSDASPTDAAPVGAFPNDGRKGLIKPFGQPDAGNGVGGTALLDFLPGFEQDFALAMKRSDGVMDRHGVECWDMFTGLPADPSLVSHNNDSIINSGYGYGPGVEAVGWTKSGKLAEFWDPSYLPGSDLRRPIWSNATAGTFENYMLGAISTTGADYSPGGKPHDLPHGRRTTATIEAAWLLWADPVAKLDFMMVAQEIEYRMLRLHRQLFTNVGQQTGTPNITLPGVGGTGLYYGGGRAFGWGLHTMAISPIQRHRDLTTAWGKLIEDRQTSYGAWGAKLTSTDGTPSPGSFGGPSNYLYEQLLEANIMALGMARAGYRESAARWTDFIHVGGKYSGGDVTDLPLVESFGGSGAPKFVAGIQDGNVMHRIQHFYGPTDAFTAWGAAGLGLFISAFRSRYLTSIYGLSGPVSGGGGGNLAGTVALLRAQGSKEITALVLSAIDPLVL